MQLTQTYWQRHTLTDREIIGLSHKMAQAESEIREKEDNLKSVATAIKAEIAQQEAVLHGCAEKLRSGYEKVCSRRNGRSP